MLRVAISRMFCGTVLVASVFWSWSNRGFKSMPTKVIRNCSSNCLIAMYLSDSVYVYICVCIHFFMFIHLSNIVCHFIVMSTEFESNLGLNWNSIIPNRLWIVVSQCVIRCDRYNQYSLLIKALYLEWNILKWPTWIFVHSLCNVQRQLNAGHFEFFQK